MGRIALLATLVLLAGAGPAGGAVPRDDRLVFMSERSGTWQLWLRDAQGLHRITRNRHADSDPTFSPDGTKLAFVRDSGFWRRPLVVLDLDTMRERRVVWSRYTAAPRWSPDGSKIAYQLSRSYTPDGSPDGTDEEIWVADAYGGPARRVARGIGYAEYAWSPDSGRLVFVTAAVGAPRLAVADVRRGGVTELTEGREPAWSTGGRIAFVREGDLYTLLLGRPMRVTRDAVEQQFPSWSPDGRRIAFVERRVGFRSAIAVVGPAGGGRRVVATVPGYASRPIWSPDGRALTFGTNMGDTHVVRLAGGSAAGILRGLQPDWSRLAPRWTGPR